MANEKVNWAIKDEQGTGSNHEVICFQVISQHPDLPTAAREARLNWKKTNWEKFTKTLRTSSAETRPRWERYQHDPSRSYLDAWAVLLRDVIKKATELSTPALDLI
jgi:hypothetical protein